LVARFIFDALQGALLVRRTTGDATQMDDAVAVVGRFLYAVAKGR
jgi:hypothetical protein